ncbi:MAG: FtsX-like permease family protein [Planctomycetes bacterium]|nr:FtsX-like permease family protein [Planctomycetota bacterium]
MYKLLLSWRYLRTRYIALASIISVTLGVATLIVVNSVMAGFTTEMHNRLHGILSDIVFESHGLGGLPDPQWHEDEIRQVLGDDLAGMTATVQVPAMLSFDVRGQWVTRQVNLIGIDEETYAQVGDFSQYLLHPENRAKLSFLLRDDSYDAPLPESGWEYRRTRVEYERAVEEQIREIRELEQSSRSGASQTVASAANPQSPPAPPAYSEVADDPYGAVPGDPYGQAAPSDSESRVFDEAQEQHTGVILGLMIASVRHRDEDDVVRDYFLCRPGDDVNLTFPTAPPNGEAPKAQSAKVTVVDLYESKMSEYDSTFAFVPLDQLQRWRGMIDPMTGVASVTSLQIKLREGADLDAARNKLMKRFPTEEYAYRIQTWKDMQGPLLAAVQMETTILNILLFLIIAVAGFGILATFFMIVVEKTRDIGILKALGAPSGGVMSIFLSYGFSLGMVGSGVGMVLGLLFVIYINEIANMLEWLTGREVFDPTVYYFQQIPAIIEPVTVVMVVIGAILIAVLASVLPALRAARLHPVEALRYE